MPLDFRHIKDFLAEKTRTKFNSEILSLFIEGINKLCFQECQIDRIQCTLTPLCTRRQLLTLRIKNGLKLNDLPKFCYSVQKNIVFRDFRNKTIIYKPFDTYIYLIDFLDIFFHGDYRKLNKFINFKNWKDIRKIFDYRIEKQKENFHYHITDNYIIFKFEERVHVIFLKEGYVLCSVNHEAIASLELLKGIVDLYNRLYFPDLKVKLINNDFLMITSIISQDVLTQISNNSPAEENKLKLDEYFWNFFSEDLSALTQYCKELRIKMNKYNNLEINIYISLESNNKNEYNESIPLRYRDMRLFLNFVYRIYNDFYVYQV